MPRMTPTFTSPGEINPQKSTCLFGGRVRSLDRAGPVGPGGYCPPPPPPPLPLDAPISEIQSETAEMPSPIACQ
ncbi:hypothetical protein GCM10010387_52440 [Streptomyces inusitatus]|uniref:Uncharacterized protein n=1 Tax=Streptomyces inusitatus TaxID=68221 RepID=A0A918QKD6_9ACTN|nr:hypothetical protein GCM10010387_52440 [Streptomyces inusitatus]